MQEPAQLVIQRTAQRFGRRRAFRIYVDRAHVGSIADGEERRFAIEPGRHEVCVRVDWCRSSVVVAAEGGEPVNLVCGSRIRGWRLLFAFVLVLVPGRCIYLEHNGRAPVARP